MRLADVKAEEVSWLWPGRVAKGKLNLLVGDPGTGKTFVALDIAARLSAGSDWPDGGIAPKTATLIMTAEDGLADTIRPRLDALGADMSGIFALEAVRTGDEERDFSFDTDLAALEQAIKETGAGLVIVDPLSAYLGRGTDSHRDADLRRVLRPLARLADLAGVAILGILHLTKDDERRLLARVQGSIAFVGAARVGVIVTRDSKNENRRLLSHLKNNLTAPAATLAFTVDELGRLVWEDDPVSDSSATTTAEDEPTKVEMATRFLREALRDGPVRHEEIKRLAMEREIADRTLWRAKGALHITATRAGDFDDRGGWEWCLPGSEDTAGHATNGSVEDVTSMADLENHGTTGETKESQSCQPAQSSQPQQAGGAGTEQQDTQDITACVAPAAPEAENLV